MLVYGALASAAVWLGAVPWTLARIASGRAPLRELRERLGYTRVPATSRPILIHGVSAGEMTAARALVDALVRRDPNVRIVLTTGTADGRALAERVRADVPHVEGCAFLPWDRPDAVERWLTHLNPVAVAIVETELWPGLFAACRRRNIPLSIVSGRLYPRDVARYRLLGRWWSTVMGVPARVLAQDDHEVNAFVAIGTPPALVERGGNLKFDAARPSASLRREGPMVVVAGSTHAPEETWILDVVARMQRAGIPCVVTVAPRDIRRAADVRTLARRRGVNDVTVLDRMGALPAAYDSAHVAICGGTLSPVGGHNIIEPAAAGCAIVCGPHVANITRLVEDLESAGGLIRVGPSPTPALALTEALTGLHLNRERLRVIGQNAARWWADRRGAADYAAALIARDCASSRCS